MAAAIAPAKQQVDAAAAALRYGRAIPIADAAGTEGETFAVEHDGRLLALAVLDGALLRPRKVFADE